VGVYQKCCLSRKESRIELAEPGLPTSSRQLIEKITEKNEPIFDDLVKPEKILPTHMHMRQ
jgi:hypothetical protein